MNASMLVQELWNCCNVLRDDGMSYGDYVEQLTYPLFISGRSASRPLRGHEPPLKQAVAGFLKMADERSRPRYSQASPIPSAYAWPALLAKDGDALFDHYRRTLETLIGGAQQGRIGRGRGSMPHLVGAAGRGRSHRSVADFLLSCNP